MKRAIIVLGALGIAACGFGGGDEERTPPAAPAIPTLSIGTPVTVQYAQVAEGQPAESGAVTLTLTITQANDYQCNAHAQQGAQALDAQMAIYQGANRLAMDSDSGDGFDARITHQVQPGTYDVKVWEWQRRASDITVSCVVAPAAPPPAANPTVLGLGAPAVVNVPQGQGAGSQPELALSVSAAGSYRCDAHAQDGSTGLDAQMAIVQNGAILQQDSDSGEGTDAMITRDLSPGLYQVRVWEWMHRAAAITVTCAPAVVSASSGPISLGAPVLASIQAGQGVGSEAFYDLTITTPGRYQCDAVSPDQDAQMAILQGSTELQQDSDSGEGRNAQIVRELAPGTYRVKVWEWLHRATQITVTCGPA